MMKKYLYKFLGATVASLLLATAIYAVDPYKANTGKDFPLHQGVAMKGREGELQNFLSNLEKITDGATITLRNDKHKSGGVTLAGDRTINPTNKHEAGKEYDLFITQDATGSRLITWSVNFKWAAGTAPTLTTTADKTDWVHFVDTGVFWYGTVEGLSF